MSGHADKLRRKAEADAALKTGYYEHADVLALLAENQRLREALEQIATLYERVPPGTREFARLACEALAGEDT